jgi:hypothetical protein
VLEFREKSSGMLPLFQLFIMHEGMSGVTLLLPQGYDPESLSLGSSGGHVTVNGLFGNLTVKTLNGDIILDTSGKYAQSGIKAGTWNGMLQVGEIRKLKDQDGAPAYEQKGTSGKLLDIHSTNGDVVIK